MTEGISKTPFILTQKGNQFESVKASWQHHIIKYTPGLSKFVETLTGVKFYWPHEVPKIANNILQNPLSEKAKSFTQSLRVIVGFDKEAAIFFSTKGGRPELGAHSEITQALFKSEFMGQLSSLKKGVDNKDANENFFENLQKMVGSDSVEAEQFFLRNPEVIDQFLICPDKALGVVDGMPDVKERLKNLVSFNQALAKVSTDKGDSLLKLIAQYPPKDPAYKDVQRIILKNPEFVSVILSNSSQLKPLFSECPLLRVLAKLDLTSLLIRPDQLNDWKNALEPSNLQKFPDTYFWMQCVFLSKSAPPSEEMKKQLDDAGKLDQTKVYQPLREYVEKNKVSVNPLVAIYFATYPLLIGQYSALKLSEKSFSNPKLEIEEFENALKNVASQDTDPLTKYALNVFLGERLCVKAENFVNSKSNSLQSKLEALKSMSFMGKKTGQPYETEYDLNQQLKEEVSKFVKSEDEEVIRYVLDNPDKINLLNPKKSFTNPKQEIEEFNKILKTFNFNEPDRTNEALRSWLVGSVFAKTEAFVNNKSNSLESRVQAFNSLNQMKGYPKPVDETATKLITPLYWEVVELVNIEKVGGILKNSKLATGDKLKSLDGLRKLIQENPNLDKFIRIHLAKEIKQFREDASLLQEQIWNSTVIQTAEKIKGEGRPIFSKQEIDKVKNKNDQNCLMIVNKWSSKLPTFSKVVNTFGRRGGNITLTDKTLLFDQPKYKELQLEDKVLETPSVITAIVAETMSTYLQNQMHISSDQADEIIARLMQNSAIDQSQAVIDMQSVTQFLGFTGGLERIESGVGLGVDINFLYDSKNKRVEFQRLEHMEIQSTETKEKLGALEREFSSSVPLDLVGETLVKLKMETKGI